MNLQNFKEIIIKNYG